MLFVLAVLPTWLFAQQVTVKGRITDSKTSAPLAGATVRVKNDKASATSDANGDFTISAPSAESIITITYVGYQVYEVKAGDGNLSIALVNLDTGLDEVVVVGYGAQKKAHLTGAVETIKAADVDHLPVGNLGAALTGRVLGASISGGTSRPGSMATITIRSPLPVLSRVTALTSRSAAGRGKLKAPFKGAAASWLYWRPAWPGRDPLRQPTA